MKAVFKREFNSYFDSPIGYVFIACFLVITGISFSLYNLLALNSDTKSLFASVGTYLIFLIPLLTMRLFAEEKKMRTDQLLFTSPNKTSAIVLGKFLAALGVYSVGLFFTLFYIALIAIFGKLEIMVTISTYIGVLLLGGAFISIGLFISALTESQMISAIATYVVTTVLWGMGSFAQGVQNPVISLLLKNLSIYENFNIFSLGVLDISTVVYYLGVIALGLFLTVKIIEKSRI